MGKDKTQPTASDSNSNESSPSPPEDSESSTSPPPQKDSSPPPSPPQDSSPPPKKSPSPPPPANSPPPPKNSSPPPSSPTPATNSSPPPSTPGSTTPSPPAADGTATPALPADGGAANLPQPAGDPVKPPRGKAFVPPPPAPGSKSTGGDSSDSSSGGSNAAVIAGVVVGGVVLLTLLICLWMLCRRKKKTQQYYNQVWNSPSPDYKQHIVTIPPGNLVGMQSPAVGTSMWSPANLPPRRQGNEGGYSPFRYPNPNPNPNSNRALAQSSLPPFSPDVFGNQSNLSYDDVVAATNGFAEANVLGQGGFGLVHKGILPGGKQVAVKSLKSGSGQGEREFQAEVEIISRVHHRHLVSLVGYCIADEKRMLVYEFVPNNTLEYHLHKSGSSLDFPTRVRIALGSAKGLAYLHEDCHPRIIHRDIKAANILLDDHFEAQVADFGLARLYNDTNTHVSTRVMGTFGYLAPEYASSGKLTEKSDVFSFGVVLLELITGRRPVDPKDRYCSLVDWARPHLAKALAEGNCFDELVDRRLEGNYSLQDMTNMVACAAASVRHAGKRRPRMSQIVRTLEGDMSFEALDGAKAGSSTPTRDYDTAAYNADLKKFQELAFGSGAFNTGTSEYGLNPSVSSSEADASPRDPAKL